jgi:hypothetical protein
VACTLLIIADKKRSSVNSDDATTKAVGSLWHLK